MKPPSGLIYNVSAGLMRRACRYRRTWPIRLLGRACYLFYRGYENRDFDFRSNGEQRCLERLSRLSPRCALDVGANVGDWTSLALRTWPEVTVHSFEIVPDNFHVLERNLQGSSRVKLNPIGLSDVEAEIDVHFSRSTHFRASAFSMPDVPDTTVVKAKVMAGDSYVASRKIERIDYLKIDVEGMEGAVLRGFRETLAAGRVRAVQFEYNTTNIVSGFLLRNAYDFLVPLGYRVGKLYPTYVDFRPYELSHEDFCGPNFIAVRADDKEVLALLS
ncbi:MAG TPA: FkbM family methyltransferase [Verrucomicrobiae bacterium]